MSSAQYEKTKGQLTEMEENYTEIIQKKLKRKNRLSISLTSVNDSVNQEKRTKIDTKPKKENKENSVVAETLEESNKRKYINRNKFIFDNNVLTKPPLPPPRRIHPMPSLLNKKKLEENNVVMQKLNAQTDQIRLKCADLKAELDSERSAVRTLRAQNEAETRKWKTEVKKLKTILEATKKLAALNGTKHSKDEVTIGKEKFKESDLLKLRDSYEVRLAQLSKSAKIEICRLLEELKMKERNIIILRNELQVRNKNKLTKTQKNNNSGKVQNSNEMKKLKEVEQRNNLKLNSNNKISNNCYIDTTCEEKDFDSMSHEMTEQILNNHNNHHDEYKINDHQNSDCDSALSSAPQSISPQPPAEESYTHTNIWKTLKNYSKDLEKFQNENHSVRIENENLRKELDLAKQKINEFNKTGLVNYNTNNTSKINNDVQQLLDKIKYLELRESDLNQDLNDLREQNELLEFRIIEIEESNDKWSSHNNQMQDSKSMLSDMEREDSSLLNDCSDSGVISPNSSNHIDDFGYSNYNYPIYSKINNEDLLRRLADIFCKTTIDNEEKICLQQAMILIKSLDTMSNTDKTLELANLKTSEVGFSLRSTDGSNNPLQKIKLSGVRVVATVSPYNSYTNSTSSDYSRKICNSLTESGVFEESSDFQYRSSKYTQTDLEDFGCTTENLATKDLCAEIQKLNKFREKIEECVTKSTSANKNSNNVTGSKILSPNLTDQKRLQYYKERVDILENKLLIYESSGDLQAKRLASRLQKEVQLENLVKDLKEQLHQLIIIKNCLEEEKCELEEAENDTRLRLQRLEVDLEILNQRNIELEMSRDSVQNKLKESEAQCSDLHEELIESHESIEIYKDENTKLTTNLKLFKRSLPALVLLNAFMVIGGNQCGQPKESEKSIYQDCKDDKKNQCSSSSSSSSSAIINLNNNNNNNEFVVTNLQKELHQIRCREQELQKKIAMIEGAYQDTLENADCLWARIEKSYEKQLAEAECKENCLKSKINQLEERLKCDALAAQEKISQLEDTESELRCLLSKISKENRNLCCELNALKEEIKCYQNQLELMKKDADGPKECLEIERCKNVAMKEELSYLKKLLCESECQHNEQIKEIKCELVRANKELQQLEITNSELKEEVNCLESQIKKIESIRKKDADKISCLRDELAEKQEEVCKLQAKLAAKSKSPCDSGPNLAQELKCSNGSPSKKMKREEVKDLPTASEMLGQTLEFTKLNCPKSKAIQDFSKMAETLKCLADTILKKEGLITGSDDLKSKCPCPKDKSKDKSKCDSNKKNDDTSNKGKNGGADKDDGKSSGNVDANDDGNQDGNVDANDDGVDDGNGDVNDDNEDDGVNEDHGGEVTVGLALVSNPAVNFKLPTKKSLLYPIMEVPSELRKPYRRSKSETRPILKKPTKTRSTGDFFVISSLKSTFKKIVSNFFESKDEENNNELLVPSIQEVQPIEILDIKDDSDGLQVAEIQKQMTVVSTQTEISSIEATVETIQTVVESPQLEEETTKDTIQLTQTKVESIQNEVEVELTPATENLTLTTIETTQKSVESIKMSMESIETTTCELVQTQSQRLEISNPEAEQQDLLNYHDQETNFSIHKASNLIQLVKTFSEHSTAAGSKYDYSPKNETQCTINDDTSLQIKTEEIDYITKYFPRPKKLVSLEYKDSFIKSKEKLSIEDICKQSKMKRYFKNAHSKNSKFIRMHNKRLDQTPVTYFEIVTPPTDKAKSKSTHIDKFILKLRQSMGSKSCFGDIENKLKARYDCDDAFKTGVNLINKICFYNDEKLSEYVPTVTEIKKVLKILKLIQELSSPITIPMLQKIETEITQKLLNLPATEKDPKIYCAVYYPVTKPTSKFL